MTFSIVARCARTGQFGVALSSSSPAVAARCAHARAGVGAVASQNVTDPRLGPRGLDLMAAGTDAPAAIAALEAEAGAHAPWRQVTAIDAQGRVAAFSGTRALGRNGHLLGTDAVAAGNMLASDAVLPSMLAAFAASPEAPLGERLLFALEAALAAGGEEGPVHSAGMLVVDKQAWPLADLRVDWAEKAPIARLRELWTLWQPQMHDYVTRALHPDAAPSYGVPGDP
ncbi:hypothetical protein Y88_0294 [Novosphingobium nitrogenifigens DSM 19370]|uniref:Major pilin protein fimA n=1 Tax=Novosphingobium nitrogenifigens DSM 19370 TaxID=983920 RepID=F1ZAY0_9SPHN|nr:DUF1028 domain-containing protein [Novosphingobium nitrogenifigens]EGD58242.1 hypothetical protein Y88_0294 [Novosphingobium nitrogenifigens DSM 19370]